MDLPRTASCVVIGGGAVGLSTACHLARGGMKDVLLLERGLLGEGSTGACMGGIRLDFATEVNVRFSLAAMPRWENFGEEFGVDAGFRPAGYLTVAASEDKWKTLGGCRPLHERLGLPVEYLGPEEIARRWPYVRTEDLLGGTYCARDGYAGPQEAVQGYARTCRRRGVRILQQTEVTGIRLSGARVDGVETARGSVSAGRVVCCAGPWAEQVGRMAGVEIPVKPIRRQVFATGPVPGLPPDMPLIRDLAQNTTYKPEGEGFILYGPQDETPGFRTQVDWDATAWAVERAVRRIPAYEEAEIARGWAGLYEISPDNSGLMGGVAGLDGFYVAGGFSGHGFMHSPVIGQAMAELILEGEARVVDIRPLALDRFARGERVLERMAFHRDPSEVG